MKMFGLKAERPRWVVGIEFVGLLVMVVESQPGVGGVHETVKEVERQIGILLPHGMVTCLAMHLGVGLMHEMVVTLV